MDFHSSIGQYSSTSLWWFGLIQDSSGLVELQSLGTFTVTGRLIQALWLYQASKWQGRKWLMISVGKPAFSTYIIIPPLQKIYAMKWIPLCCYSKIQRKVSMETIHAKEKTTLDGEMSALRLSWSSIVSKSYITFFKFSKYKCYFTKRLKLMLMLLNFIESSTLHTFLPDPPGPAKLTYSPWRVVKGKSLVLSCSIKERGRPEAHR